MKMIQSPKQTAGPSSCSHSKVEKLCKTVPPWILGAFLHYGDGVELDDLESAERLGAVVAPVGDADAAEVALGGVFGAESSPDTNQ
jgi:hypothetical protein